MPAKEQIKIHALKGDYKKDTSPKQNVRSRIIQMSVSSPTEKTEISRKIKEKKKVLTLKDIMLNVIKFVTGIPSFLTNFLNTSTRLIYYAILGTMLSFIFAVVLFPTNPGIFSVFFLTIFLAPFVIKEINLNVMLIGRTQKVELNGIYLTNIKIKENEEFTLTQFYEENKKILAVYFFFFVGIMLVVTALIAFMPIQNSAQLFGQQGWSTILMPSKDIGFQGVNKWPAFFGIVKNNMSVLVVCFVVALVFPLGALLMIVWNAMYWAVSFTQYAVFYSQAYHVSLLFILVPLFLSVSLHTIIEAFCYFLAAMSGNTLATGIKKEKLNSDRLFYILKYCSILLVFAMLFLLVGSLAEVFVFDYLKNFFFGLF